MKNTSPFRARAAAFVAAAGSIWFGAWTAFGQDETFLLNTVENQGEIIIFHGPDDLHLDPASVIIAVDCYGDDDVEVNGVTFIADKTDISPASEKPRPTG
jgi:hypothetical protein